jgi:hypothetical protein
MARRPEILLLNPTIVSRASARFQPPIVIVGTGELKKDDA